MIDKFELKKDIRRNDKNLRSIEEKESGITLIALVITIIVILILAGISIMTLMGENGLITKVTQAKETNIKGQAEEEVELAIANLQILERTTQMTQEEKRAELENELKKKKEDSTVTIDGTGFLANHRGYNVEISDTYEVAIKEPFNAEEWDKKAAPADVFIWGSDDPNDGAYGTVVGYTANVDNYPVLRYPSRCVCISFDSSMMPSGESAAVRNYTKNIKKIELPESLLEIGEGAFNYYSGDKGYNFNGIEEFVIPRSTNEIGESAFGFCKGITSVTILGNVMKIKATTFRGCDNLVSVKLPDSVKEIGKGAFQNCTKLKNVNIPNGVTSIGDNAFQDCDGLEEITLPGTLINFGSWAFEGCDGLKRVDLEEGIVEIPHRAFSVCRNLLSIGIPESVRSIGEYAFDGCGSLKCVTLPEGLDSLGYHCFGWCTGIEVLVIPAGVTRVDGYVFYEWTSRQVIKCRASSRPNGWVSYWNTGSAVVEWGYTGE